MMVLVSTAQIKTRYVEIGSTHALSINENTDYRFEWTIQTPSGGMISVSSNTARTENVVWDQRGRYHVTVVPLLDSIDCYGENVKMDVVTLDYLSLHTFDDVYYTTINATVSGDISANDFDEQGSQIFYNPTPVSQPEHGTLDLGIDGTFTYTPDNDFEGVDEFVYEAFVREGSDNEMYSNSKVTIVVQDDVRQSDLYIEKTGPKKALYGQTIHYSIKLINNGPHVAQNVMLKDTLAFGLFDAQYKIGNEPPYLPWNDSLKFETMGIGDSIVLYIRTVISPNAPDAIYNQAITWSETFDPNYTDNDSIWPIEISSIYADLPGQVHVASCETYILPGDSSDANIEIESYEWTPSTGLSDTTISNPVFTPDASTYGKSIEYILTVTDENGNQAQDTIELVVAKQPLAIIEADTLYKDLDTNIVIDGSGSKGGNGLSFDWSTADGQVESNPYTDSIIVSSTGTYHLEVIDRFGCYSLDSVVVLLQSYPPVVINDSISIVAGDTTVLPNFGVDYLALAVDPGQQQDYLEALPDSNLNVLYNDYDLNGFDLEVTEIVTPPSSGFISYNWDSTGQFIIVPDSSFWGSDSLQYRVCNNGQPVKCSTAWVYINSLRPPLSADVKIVKTGENIKSNDGQDIAFWGDTIHYRLQVTNSGPDTISTVTITDVINSGFLNPQYSINNEPVWNEWPLNDRFVFPNSIKPGEDTLNIQLKAYIREEAERFITNKAYIETEIIENYLLNDTSIVTTKIKEAVLADAGRDTLLGSCIDDLILDGSESIGEDISFSWSPVNHAQNHLTDADTPTPVFINPGIQGNYLYELAVTDNDNITVTDTVSITVIPPPKAMAVNDYYEIIAGDTIGLDGGASQPSKYIVSYKWEAISGNIIPGTENQRVTAIDAVGDYRLIVTDIAGCKDTTIVPVYLFYYAPVTIPDYYSTKLGQTLRGNLLDNDFDPNQDIFGENFQLTAKPASFTTPEGAQVTIESNGDFVLIPGGAYQEVVSFTYEVYNDAELSKTTVGYARITVNLNVNIARLNIHKQAVNRSVLIGERHAARFEISITNVGPDLAEDVLLTDSLPEYFRNDAVAIVENGREEPFSGTLELNDIESGGTVNVEIRATVGGGAPKHLFNAAMSSSPIFDDQFDWDIIATRNVDTTSVITESNLFADAELVERFDDNKSDGIIGRCDYISYLTAENSEPEDGINGWSWSPGEYLISDSTQRVNFNYDNLPDKDTIVNFRLTVSIDGGEYAFDNVDVHFSQKVIADAGPDVKINEDEVIYIDQATAQGSEIEIKWFKYNFDNTKSVLTEFNNDNELQPVIRETGRYELQVTDRHGCIDSDVITVKQNSLYLVDDIINVVKGDTIVGNVSTNDFDPEGDSIYYTTYADGPAVDDLLIDPANSGFLKSVNAVVDVIGEDGSFVYVAPDDFVGYTYFTYEGCDDNHPTNMCKEGTVHIRVVDIDGTNTPPVANPDYLFANQGDTIRTNILANDYDPDGGVVTVEDIVTDPAKGQILYSDGVGNIVYVPNMNATGTDQFVYQVCDNGTTTGCNTARVIIEIHKIPQENHPPVAGDDAYFAVEKAIEGNILDNDYDPDGDAFSLIREIIEGPYHADSFSLNRDGSFTYIPKPGFEGTDQIVYQIQESAGMSPLSDMATVYILSLSEDRYKTDVIITKTAVEEKLSGQYIVYDLKVKVDGPTLANDIIYIDELDSVLTDAQFSVDNGQTWSAWTGQFHVDQMMLFEENTIKVRARVPDIYAGDLYNTACVEHDMGEMNEDNNCHEISTGIYQRVIADAGQDTTIGYCAVDGDFYVDASNSLGMSSLEYLWVSEKADVQNPDSEQTSITANPGTVNEIMLVVSSSINGLTDSDTAYVNVTVARETQAWAGNDVWPENADPVLFDGSSSTGPEGGLDYSWWIYDSEGNVEVLGESATIEVNKTNDYYLTVTDKFGCTSTDMVHVGYPVDPYEAVDDHVETYQQEEIDINILANDLIDEDDEYDYELLIILDYPEHGELVVNPYDSIVTYIPEPYYFGPDTFSYQMSTINNFTDNATVYVDVLQKLPVIPDGFSPNADGINDYLIIENIELYPESSITIFNRWGNVIYEKTPYLNDEPWDGVANQGIRIGNGVVPTGVYLYIVDLGDDDRLSQKVYKGNLYIASDNRR